MKIYLLISSYFDGCNNWRETEAAYLDEDKAEYECEILREQNKEERGSLSFDSRTYYNVEELEVDETIL